MPKHRPPAAVWKTIRVLIWTRDGGRCTHCHKLVSVKACHIDHIQAGKLAGNELRNLRTLCRRCHVLRADSHHRGMISAALRDGIIPPDWRKEVWE
jgi:5-methylcytosine-specific restriction endonuclease McrA